MGWAVNIPPPRLSDTPKNTPALLGFQWEVGNLVGRKVFIKYIIFLNVGCYRIVLDAQVAEGVGFEPTIRFPVYKLSRLAP